MSQVRLKDVYTATDEEEAKKALDEFAASDLGQKYPQSVKVWEDAWDMIYSISAVPTSSAEGYLHHQFHISR